MDEPTNGLDIPGKSQFRKFIASGMSDDKTIVISTHQVRDIDKVLDHVLIMMTVVCCSMNRQVIFATNFSLWRVMIGNWPKVRFLQFLLFRVTT